MAIATKHDALSGSALHGLPFFVTGRNRHAVAVLIFVAGLALYLVTNHVHLRDPRLLPLTWVDSHVPFLPDTIWIYNSEYIYFAIIYGLICADLETLNKYCFSILSLLVASGLVFILWPTTYPRGGFPLPAHLNAATAEVFRLLRRADTPANCCPSLHVSAVYLSAFVFLDRRQRARFIFFFVWATLIALSTLTTKQHYLIDVVSGFGMAVLFYGLFHRLAAFGFKREPGIDAQLTPPARRGK